MDQASITGKPSDTAGNFYSFLFHHPAFAVTLVMAIAGKRQLEYRLFPDMFRMLS